MQAIQTTELLSGLIKQPDDIDLAELLMSNLINDEGKFFRQEDTLFDYKKTFPHSMSDEYFYTSIIRLVFAFYNTYGGVIVFGVCDETRLAGKNPTLMNIERLNTRIREICGITLNLKHIPMGAGETKVDLIVVPRRAPNLPPITNKIKISKYEIGTLWLRRGHEVLEAESKDVNFLFSPRLNLNGDDLNSILSELPPNPSLSKSFVGRVDVLSELYSWIACEDEPRKFLWGRGGSGKSTIAFEFARLIRDFGSMIKLEDGSYFDRVIFLTAKEVFLSTTTGKIETTHSTDFSDVNGLLTGIITLCNYPEEIGDFPNKASLSACVKEIFDCENLLLVIDDIDTLTTKNEDAGIDLLYKLAIRSKGEIRILYTQRNSPVSVENAIEVKGFTKNLEYMEFIQNCCKIFDVPLPDPAFCDGALRKNSEGIPLIIENIIGLRKRSGNYPAAMEIFLSRSGDEARRYLFEREYNALPTDNQARLILSAISYFAKPVKNIEIIAVVEYGESKVADAIGQLLGIFVSTEISKEGDTQYFVNPVTSKFVAEKSKGLKYANVVKERVKVFKAGIQKKPKEVVILENLLQRYLAQGRIDEAYSQFNTDFSEKITENPEFRMLRAITAAHCEPPKIFEASEDFQYCTKMNFEHAEGMRVWWNLERNSGYSHDAQIRICDLVIDGKSYAEVVKNEFISKKGSSLYMKARSLAESNLSDAYSVLELSLINNLQSFVFFESQGRDSVQQFEHARNTAFLLTQYGHRLDFDAVLIRSIRKILKEFDDVPEPLFEPLVRLILKFKNERNEAKRARRTNLALQLISDFKSGKLKFRIQSTTKNFLDTASV